MACCLGERIRSCVAAWAVYLYFFALSDCPKMYICSCYSFCKYSVRAILWLFPNHSGLPTDKAFFVPLLRFLHFCDLFDSSDAANQCFIPGLELVSPADYYSEPPGAAWKHLVMVTFCRQSEAITFIWWSSTTVVTSARRACLNMFTPKSPRGTSAQSPGISCNLCTAIHVFNK